MRYRRLGYFVAVAEELSFTRAARRLHMAQPPLSQQIALLEKEVGTPLFDRSRRTIRLTAAGAALLPEARRLIADLDQTVRMVRNVGEGTVGRLAVGFVPSAMGGVLPDLLRQFGATHPAVELTLREMAPDALLRAVHDGRLDVAVVYLPISEPDLAQRRLASENLLERFARPAEIPLAKPVDPALGQAAGPGQREDEAAGAARVRRGRPVLGHDRLEPQHRRHLQLDRRGRRRRRGRRLERRPHEAEGEGRHGERQLGHRQLDRARRRRAHR